VKSLNPWASRRTFSMIKLMASVPLSVNVVVPLLRWLDPKQLDFWLFRCLSPVLG
jgi:hypothetical protein